MREELRTGTRTLRWPSRTDRNGRGGKEEQLMMPYGSESISGRTTTTCSWPGWRPALRRGPHGF
jgi:hypothetical protein